MGEVVLKVKGYRCERCNHVWIPRTKIDEKPVICPACKSPYWNIPRRKKENKKRGVN